MKTTRLNNWNTLKTNWWMDVKRFVQIKNQIIFFLKQNFLHSFLSALFFSTLAVWQTSKQCCQLYGIDLWRAQLGNQMRFKIRLKILNGNKGRNLAHLINKLIHIRLGFYFRACRGRYDASRLSRSRHQWCKCVFVVVKKTMKRPSSSCRIGRCLKMDGC